MKIQLPFVVLLGLITVAFASPPYEPYEPREPYSLKIKGKEVTIKAIMVSTYSESGVRALTVQYVPSTTSQDMWDHMVEMYDVAQHFVPLAIDQNTTKVAVTPLINTDGRQDTTYTYSVNEGVAVSDWRVEFQSWFRSPRNASSSP